MALGRCDQQEPLAARPRGRDLVGEALQLAMEQVRSEDAEIDRLARSRKRQHGAGRVLDHRQHLLDGVFEQGRLEGEALVLAARRELLRQALSVMTDLGDERRRIQSDPGRRGKQLGESEAARGEERQEILPTREPAAVGERGEVIARLPAGILASEVGEQTGQPPRRLGSFGKQC